RIAGITRANAERLVFSRSPPASQSETRLRLIAASVARCYRIQAIITQECTSKMNEKLGESEGFDVESKTFLPSIFNAPPRNRRGIGTVAIEINLSSSGCSFGQSASERQAGSKHCHRLAGGAARVPARPGSARHDR